MIVPANRLALLENGTQYFPALLAAIDSAEAEVRLESYLYEADGIGLAVAEALMRAAARGVRVYLLLDGFGANGFSRELAERLSAAGVAWCHYRPEHGLLRLRRHRLRRLHRKLVAVDGRVAFVGGINIIADDNAPGHPSHRYDYAVRVEGPLVHEIHAAMRRLWWLVEWSRSGRRVSMGSAFPVPAAAGTQAAELLLRDNWRHRRRIEEAYFKAIRDAKHEIVIANAYFLPGWRFRHALAEAAQRGVRVVLLLQGRIEYRIQHYATLALYRFFLERGVEIYEYRSSFLHAKVAVVDRSWATVGSSNIDPFSLVLAREANIAVHDRAFASDLHARIFAALRAGANQVHRLPWRLLPWHRRALAWLGYGVVRALAGLVGYAREFGGVDGDVPGGMKNR
ncbi:MAG: cardiolipin synthase ClsB [Betaproteobacteria bacterium]|nr:cardiolipin synthase ClsB [Betaproteobacteria bacterium]